MVAFGALMQTAAANVQGVYLHGIMYTGLEAPYFFTPSGSGYLAGARTPVLFDLLGSTDGRAWLDCSSSLA